VSGAEPGRVAERAFLVRFRDADLGRAVTKAQALYSALAGGSKERGVDALERLVLGAGAVLVEPTRAVRDEGFDLWCAELEKLVERVDADELQPNGSEGVTRAGREHRIEVRFGGDGGVDLSEVAGKTGMSEDEVVRRLCAADLRVAFLGFCPGYPYLVGLPRELELPRRSSPRPSVPAGSVAIAGQFAGIYPSSTPGGWHLLGRTESVLFDPLAEPPALFAPGDRARLVAS